MNLFSQIFSTWRSLASVIIAYAIIGVMFFYKPDLLVTLLGYATSLQAELLQYAQGSKLGAQAATLLLTYLPPAALLLIGVMLFSRAILLALVLWIGSQFLGRLKKTTQTA